MEQFFESQGEHLTNEEREGLRAYESWKMWVLWKDAIRQPISPPISPQDSNNDVLPNTIDGEINSANANHNNPSNKNADILRHFLLSRSFDTPTLPNRANSNSSSIGYLRELTPPPPIYHARPDVWVELQCRDQVITPLTTLATIKAHAWKFNTDIQVTYRWNIFITNRVILTSRMKI